MKHYWKQRNRQSELLVLFNGWGCDETLFETLSPGKRAGKHDCLILSDYTVIGNVNFDFLRDYRDVTVLAWSFGVFVASTLLSHRFTNGRAIAVNGTPCPINDEYGIPRTIFYGTLNSYNETNRRKFERRMIGHSRPSDTALCPRRTTESQLHELAALAKNADGPSEQDESIHSLWSLALIAEQDRIFPPENMKRYWGEKGISIPGGHLPDFQTVIDQY